MMHHPDDRRWIEEQVSKLPKTHWQKIRAGYDQAFREAYENETVPHRKEGAGRFAANTRLRRYVEAVLSKKPRPQDRGKGGDTNVN